MTVAQPKAAAPMIFQFGNTVTITVA